MEDREISPILTVGLVVGGAFASPVWEATVKSLGRQVKAIRANYDSVVRVGVVYHIPGEVTRPRFTGVRSRRYAKQQGLIIIDIALPEQPGDDPAGEVRDLLERAIIEADRLVRKEGTADKLVGLHDLIAKLPAGHGSPGRSIG